MIRKRFFLYVLTLTIALTVLNFTMPLVKAQYRLIDLKALGNFNFDPIRGAVADIPPSIRRLDGQKVRVIGFMWNPNAARSANSFQFVYNFRDSFGQPPLIQERIFATVHRGTAVISDDYVSIEGTLHIHLNHANGAIVSVFQLDVDDIWQDLTHVYPEPFNPTPSGWLPYRLPLALKDVVELATYACWMFTAVLGALCAFRGFRAGARSM
jgi:hypothetical protein